MTDKIVISLFAILLASSRNDTNSPDWVTAAEQLQVSNSPPGLHNFIAAALILMYLFLALYNDALDGASLGGSAITTSKL